MREIIPTSYAASYWEILDEMPSSEGFDGLTFDQLKEIGEIFYEKFFTLKGDSDTTIGKFEDVFKISI